MSKTSPPLESLRDLVSGLAGGATAIGAVAIGADPMTALVAGSSATELTKQGSDRLLTKLASAQALRARTASEQLFGALAAELASIPDAEMRRRKITEWIADENRDEFLLEGFRELLDSHDRSIWPALAALTAEYYSSCKPPDPFFRQTSELLKSLVRGDIPAVRAIIDLVVEHFPEGGPLEINGRDGTLRVCREVPSKGYEHFVESPFPKATEPFRRTLQLLKSHDFGYDPPTGRWGGGDPSSGIVFDTLDLPSVLRLKILLELCEK